MSAAVVETRASSDARAGRTPIQRYLAEFIGTFVLVFIGCGSVVSNSMSGGSVTLPGIAGCFGLGLINCGRGVCAIGSVGLRRLGVFAATTTGDHAARGGGHGGQQAEGGAMPCRGHGWSAHSFLLDDVP